jgi:hypothetical protein
MIYKEIPGFPNYYAGSDGEIYSDNYRWKKPGHAYRKLKYGKQITGYRLVNLPCKKSKNGFRCQRVHVLICSAFHGIRPKGKECSHLDGDKQNNKPENLKWETSSENKIRKVQHGTHDRGCNNSRAVFTIEDVLAIKEMLEKNIPHKHIASIIECSRTTISRIANKQRYI